MENEEIFYRGQRLAPREPRLVPRKKQERILSDRLIMVFLAIQVVMILIVLALHFS